MPKPDPLKSGRRNSASADKARSTKTVDRELIAQVALQIIDEVGIEALTLRLVARRLHIKAPSLYNHVNSKAELLELVAKQLLGTPADYPENWTDWREMIILESMNTRRALLDHPKVAPLLLRFFPREFLLKTYERSIGRFGAPPEYFLMIVEGAEKLTYGSALFAAASKAQGKPAMPPFDAGRYPNLARAIHASPSKDADALFVDTLRQFLKSIPDAEARGSASGAATRRASSGSKHKRSSNRA